MQTSVIDKVVCEELLGPGFGWFEKGSIPVIFASERNKIDPGWFSLDDIERCVTRLEWAEKFQPDLLSLDKEDMLKFLS